MPTQPVSTSNGEFLVRKCVFLLTSSVGQALAAKIVEQGMKALKLEAATLTETDIAGLSVEIEPALRPFVGDEKARRLASALRVLVGGAKIAMGGER